MNEQGTTQVTRSEGGVPEAVQQTPAVAPAIDIFENKDEVLLIADLPGVKPDAVNVRVEKDQLIIEGTRAEEEHRGATPLATEYRPVDYRRVFVLPRGIDATRLEAQFRQGVLTLHLPKSDAIKPRQIKVTAS